MSSVKPDVNRRDFLGTVAAAGAVFLVQPQSPARVELGEQKAPDGRVLKAGLIGCGGRGRGAAVNFLDAGPNLQIVALADVFPDRVKSAQELIKKQRGQDVPDAKCFTGFDAYQKLIASDVDIVLNATPPHFRPMHFAAAVDAGKHCFLEKPVSVDPAGARAVMATAEKAAAKGLSVMTGTQLRREAARIEIHNRVRDGAIGDIRALRAIRNQGALWHRQREAGWSDMEYMLRDWVNWTWLSGDHVVEQHIHHLDAMVWIMGKPPVKAVSMGGRARRATGDQYDFFSTDYTFDDGAHMHSTIRQINGCANVRDETLVGTKGSASLDGIIYDLAGKVVWKFEGKGNDSLIQEHADFVRAIRANKPINTAKDTAISTLVAIMGRDSAYTGAAVTWDDMMKSEAHLGPTEYALGPVNIQAIVPVPGTEAPPPLTQ